MQYGPQAALIAESFTPRLRYSGASIGYQLASIVFTAFIFAYGVTVLHASRDLLLAGVLAATCVSAITIPLSGYVSDRIGRKKMYIIGAATMGVFGFIYFGLIDTGSSVLIFVAMVLSLIHNCGYLYRGNCILEGLYRQGCVCRV